MRSGDFLRTLNWTSSNFKDARTELMAESTQDRWGSDRKLKRIHLSVGQSIFVLEGDNLALDADTFELIEIWVKAITPVGQEDIDKLTGKLKANNDALANTVGANQPKET
jgi:hypothetical protein